MAFHKERIVSATLRRLIYVLSYELIAIILTAAGLRILGHGGADSTLVAVASSLTALIWNYLFNLLFEAWERRQASARRTLRRRIAHALGFEGGLVIFLVPVLALLLGVPLLEAFLLEAGLLLFFLLYTFAFSWCFDRIVPPARLREQDGAAA